MLQIVLEKNAREAWYCNNSSVPLGIFYSIAIPFTLGNRRQTKKQKRDVFGERRVRRNSHSGTASAGTAWAHVPSDDRNLVPSNSPLAIWRGLPDVKIHLGLWGWKMDSSCFKLSRRHWCGSFFHAKCVLYIPIKGIVTCFLLLS